VAEGQGEEMTTRQELFCTECRRYVQFNLDLDGDGNYTIPCPNCGHEHYRAVKDGKVTETRWGSSGTSWTITGATTTSASTFDTYSTASTGDSFLYESWMNTTTRT
jgi:hypothetical protein